MGWLAECPNANATTCSSLKVFNAIGERIGEQECQDLKHQDRIKKGTKRLMKGKKDLRIEFLILMASMNSVAGERDKGLPGRLHVVCDGGARRHRGLEHFAVASS